MYRAIALLTLLCLTAPGWAFTPAQQQQLDALQVGESVTLMEGTCGECGCTYTKTGDNTVSGSTICTCNAVMCLPPDRLIHESPLTMTVPAYPIDPMAKLPRQSDCLTCAGQDATGTISVMDVERGPCLRCEGDTREGVDFTCTPVACVSPGLPIADAFPPVEVPPIYGDRDILPLPQHGNCLKCAPSTGSQCDLVPCEPVPASPCPPWYFGDRLVVAVRTLQAVYPYTPAPTFRNTFTLMVEIADSRHVFTQIQLTYPTAEAREQEYQAIQAAIRCASEKE